MGKESSCEMGQIVGIKSRQLHKMGEVTEAHYS